jgi:hypothetical protein
MIVRAAQMDVFETAAEEDFVRRLSTHLLENYANSIVLLPDLESVVKDLPEETLDLLVGKSIKRARSYELSFESAISAFSAIMFDVAPNFDQHSMSKLCLNDDNIEPNARLNELLKILTDEHWEKMKSDYDVNAWLADQENAEEPENTDDTESAKSSDFAATVMNVAPTEKPDKPGVAKQPDFAETVMNFETPKKPEKTENAEDFNFLDTVVNIDTKEN